jgi:hypothetical protein
MDLSGTAGDAWEILANVGGKAWASWFRCACLGSRRGYNIENLAGVERNLVASEQWSRTACRVYINMQSGL